MPPSALVRELYSAGEIAAEDYDALLRLMETRNGVVHGFSIPVTTEQVSALRTVVDHLFQELHAVSE